MPELSWLGLEPPLLVESAPALGLPPLAGVAAAGAFPASGSQWSMMPTMVRSLG